MRSIVIAAALLTLVGCGSASGAGEPQLDTAALAPAELDRSEASAEANTAAPAAAGFPAGFPSDDAVANGSACYLYLMISTDAADADTGFDGPAMEQAANQWRAQLLRTMTEQEVQQLTASDTNSRLQTPTPERNAAARWCVDNAPEIDPEG